jgi:hypothetical protein
MTDLRIIRIAGICSLATIAVFFIEFPFYLVRGHLSSMVEIYRPDFAARNAGNIMTCVLLDLFLLGFFIIFSAGLRHLIRKADPQHEWLGTLFFGVALVFAAITFVADSLQGATVIDALTVPGDFTIIRTMIESTFLLYGSVALFLLALLMAIASYATMASAALPKWSGWVGYSCALACLVFVPSMFVGRPDIFAFYNPAGWGPEAVASGFPLAVWMITIGILMVRKGKEVASSTIAPE